MVWSSETVQLYRGTMATLVPLKFYFVNHWLCEEATVQERRKTADFVQVRSHQNFELLAVAPQTKLN